MDSGSPTEQAGVDGRKGVGAVQEVDWKVKKNSARVNTQLQNVTRTANVTRIPLKACSLHYTGMGESTHSNCG